MSHQEALNKLELEKARRLAEIETTKFDEIVSAIGSETIVAMSSASQESKAQLLKGLGLSSVIVTDSESPVNLFGMASSLLGQN